MKVCIDIHRLLEELCVVKKLVVFNSYIFMFFKESRKVTQYQYTGWPDHGIPNTTTSLAKLRKLVNDEYKNLDSENPIAVHCRYNRKVKHVYQSF